MAYSGSNFDVVVVGMLGAYPMAPAGAAPARRLLSKGVNQAIAVARLGGRVALIGRLCPQNGDLLQLLADEGVDTAGVLTGGGRHLEAADLQHAHRFVHTSAVMLTQLELPLQTVQLALRMARAYGVRTILDPAPPRRVSDELLGLVDVLRPNAQ
ncbi:MAG: hypothetical protein EOO40_05165, partial [Deltaproteobacteria bacterium]